MKQLKKLSILDQKMIDILYIDRPANVRLEDGFSYSECMEAPYFSMRVMEKEKEVKTTISFTIGSSKNPHLDGENGLKIDVYPDDFRDDWGDNFEVKEGLIDYAKVTITFKNSDYDEYAKGSLTREKAVQKILEKLSKLSYSDIVA